MSEEWKTDPTYEQVHAKRYALSMEFLAPLLTEKRKIVEMGEPSSFAEKLMKQGHGIRATGGYDLAYPCMEFGQLRDWADVVLCMELIEHVHDQTRHRATEWDGSGTRQVLAHAFSMLKGGGHLFLTTPNTCSFNAIEKALHMEPPFVYRPHTREYAPREIAQMVTAAGFTIVKFETPNPWSGEHAYPAAKELVRKLGFPSPHRGECIFVLAQKPQ